MPSAYVSAAQDPRIPGTYAPAGTMPHPVKLGAIAFRCYGCGHLAPDSAAQDPHGIHNVPGVCEYGCKRPTPPYTTVHEECRAEFRARRQRPAEVQTYDDDGTPELPEKRKSSGGSGYGEGQPAHPRSAEVKTWLSAYTGRHPFLLDMQAIALGRTKWDRLTFNQVNAVAKFIDNDKPKPAPVERPAGPDLTVLPEGRTRYAVDNDSGGLTFLLIDRPEPLDRFKQPNKWHGWVFVKQQQGPAEVKVGAQRPGGTYTGQWQNLIQKVLADPLAAAIRYGQELGICAVCGSPLTNEASRSDGIGPVCKAKLAA